MPAPTFTQRIESLAIAFGRLGTNVEYSAQQVSDILFRELRDEVQYQLADKAQRTEQASQ